MLTYIGVWVKPKIIERRKAQDAELGLKCEIPLDAISASNSFDTTSRSVQISADNDHFYQWETKHSLAEMAPMRISRSASCALRRSIIFGPEVVRGNCVVHAINLQSAAIAHTFISLIS